MLVLLVKAPRDPRTGSSAALIVAMADHVCPAGDHYRHGIWIPRGTDDDWTVGAYLRNMYDYHLPQTVSNLSSGRRCRVPQMRSTTYGS